MKARDVHAVLAAAVENPALIEQWRTSPARLAAHRVDPEAVDLDAVARFAGLTLKVRHNQLREPLPSTFRLLGLLELDIEIFTAYAADLAARGARLAQGTDERTRALIEFLARWLDLERVEHLLLWDLIRHEHAIATLARREPAPITVAEQREPRATTLPRVVGEILLNELASDPREVTNALWVKDPDRHGILQLQRPTYLAYWRIGGDLRTVELDAFGYYLLSLVDGERTAADLHAELCGSRRPTRAFLELLRQLAATGLVTLDGRT